MELDLARIQALAVQLLRRTQHLLLHPTRRGILWSITALPALGLLYVLALIPFTPSIDDIRKARITEPARIVSADGQDMAVFKRANRAWVQLNEMSPHLVKALVATEDHRFYEHFGLDLRRTASAALRTFTGDRQGGSTITQQLARNLYPEEIGRAPTLTRKVKEAITAIKIESLYSKDEILETYLNTVPFLYNAFGIEMAARTYFDKPARNLDVLESATLIGMLKGTSYYNPVLNPDRAEQRRNTVLSQMLKRGELSEAEFNRLKQRPLRLDFERQTEAPGEAPHFTQQLRQWLIEWADQNDYDIYADGLVVHTTIDSRLQAWATQAVQRQGRQLQAISDNAWAPASVWSTDLDLVQTFVRESKAYQKAKDEGQTDSEIMARLSGDAAFMRALKEEKTQVQASFMALDPQSGEIRAWVGSRDFQQDQFDHVQQARRQPGSTFKPFVYAAAFMQGAKPTDTLPDKALEIKTDAGDVWSPTDGRTPSGRNITLRSGLIYSKNIITAQLMLQVGVNKVVNLARDMGVNTSKLEPVPSLSLGTSPVTLHEMVNAYGTIANGGRYIAPRFVTRIEDREGKVLGEFAMPKPKVVLPPEVDATLLDVMRGVIDKGTGSAIRSRYGLRADLAGKTGTTQNNTDGWFIMMHGQLVGGAWVGFNDNRITLRSDYWGRGAQSALPIVGEVFQQALRNRMLDARLKLGEHDPDVIKRVNDWLGGVLQPAPAASAASEADEDEALSADVVSAMPSTSAPSSPDMPGSATQPGMSATAPSSAGSTPRAEASRESASAPLSRANTQPASAPLE
ncbi:MAG: transglycosylase domain-containing protein [Aquabacterium sp.]|jgi:penicillin-binding protein 1A|uniref:penicillin-binding protein 1A n=1 Tax=Aquabacterium sp. TaxID=1872578 RepID=UPI001B62FAB9|nr:transglycosylase domain-containing protein [Aquabacterium sp.]MBP7131489.1 transglycosylase domain-containing protein [Aquabacterium sp.]